MFKFSIELLRYVHGTCDSDADLSTYQSKKESIPDYDYLCPVCKSSERTPLQRRKDSKRFGFSISILTYNFFLN